MADGCVNGMIGGGRNAFIGAVASRNRPEVVVAGGVQKCKTFDSIFHGALLHRRYPAVRMPSCTPHPASRRPMGHAADRVVAVRALVGFEA